MRRFLLPLPLLLLAALPLPAAGQSRDERRRDQVIRRLARQLDVPEDALSAAGGERYAARDAATRRELLRDLGARPDGRLLPLVVDAALSDADFPCRHAAVRLLSVVGLDGDRDAYLGRVLPALPRLYAHEAETVFVEAADEANRLARWFRCDAEVAPLLERTYAQTERLRLSQKAFYGILQLDHPALRADLAQRVLREVLEPRTRFGVFERKRAALEVGRRGGPLGAPALAELMLADGTVAVECAQSLGRLGDASVLPALRRIDRTAAHVLRIPVLDARARLGDDTLLGELPATLESDHAAIQAALVDALAELDDRRVDAVLARLAATVTDAALRRSVALSRLRRGDGAGVDLLAEQLRTGDARLAGRVLDVRHAAVAPLVLELAGNAHADLVAARERAVDRLGESALASGAGRRLLRDLQAGAPSGLRLRAAASLLQLGEADGVAAVESALAGLDVVTREEVDTGVGLARRFTGSPLLSVCDRLARAECTAVVPLLARWLDPPAAAGPALPAGTRERDGVPLAPAPPDVAWLAHGFVRRGAVEALGTLAGALARSQAPASAPLLERAVAALARRLDDANGVVRCGAVRALARLGGRDLTPGASLADEEATLAEVRRWLAARPAAAGG